MIYNFVIFVATKKVGQQAFSPSSFVAVVESGIRDLAMNQPNLHEK
jgi:hypothetical protein